MAKLFRDNTDELTTEALTRLTNLMNERHYRIDDAVLAEPVVLDDILDADVVDELPYG